MRPPVGLRRRPGICGSSTLWSPAPLRAFGSAMRTLGAGRPLHLHLGHHLEAHAVVPRTKLPNVGRAWLLHAKLIAREAEDDQALVFVHVVQFLQQQYCGVYPQRDAVFTMSTRLPLSWLKSKSSPSKVVALRSWKDAMPGVGLCQVLVLKVFQAKRPAAPRTNAPEAKMVVMFMGEKRPGLRFCSMHPTAAKA